MKKIGIILVAGMVLMAALMGAAGSGEGEYAEVSCEEHERFNAQLTFLFVTDGGDVVYEHPPVTAKALGCDITLSVSEGEITGAAADVGTLTVTELNGSSATLNWLGKTGEQGTITVTVSGLPETPVQPLAVSYAEALKLLHLAGVQVDGSTGVAGVSCQAGERVELVRDGDVFAGEVPADAAVTALEVAYYNAGSSGTVQLAAGMYIVSGGEVSSGRDVCAVEFWQDGTLVERRYVTAGERIGALPELPADGSFTGWLHGSEAVTAESRFYSDAMLTAGNSTVSGDKEAVYLSNVDGELIGALEDMYGYVDAGSLRACLVGTFSRGNEDYFENGWSRDGDYYVIYNCTSMSDAGTEYENSYVPLDELRYVTLFAQSGGETVTLRLDMSRLAVEDDVIHILYEDGFLELDKGDYAYMDGRSEGMFVPGGSITRAEATEIFYRCLTEESRESLREYAEFADVDRRSWYYESVSTMAGAGVIEARYGRYFMPDAPITRAEFTVLAVRTLGLRERGGSSFTDTAGSWAEGSINAAARQGIISGYEDGSFRPENGITRAEAAKILNELLERSGPVPAVSAWSDVSPDAWYYQDVFFATNGWLRY